MLFNEMYNLFFKRFFTFKGRSSRKEYIARILLTFIIFVISAYSGNDIVHYDILSLIYIWILVICLWISIIQYFLLSIRRLHDLNESGWYVLLTFVPITKFFILWLMFRKGTQGTNKYGEPPII